MFKTWAFLFLLWWKEHWSFKRNKRCQEKIYTFLCNPPLRFSVAGYDLYQKSWIFFFTLFCGMRSCSSERGRNRRWTQSQPRRVSTSATRRWTRQRRSPNLEANVLLKLGKRSSLSSFWRRKKQGYLPPSFFVFLHPLDLILVEIVFCSPVGG